MLAHKPLLHGQRCHPPGLRDMSCLAAAQELVLRDMREKSKTLRASSNAIDRNNHRNGDHVLAHKPLLHGQRCHSPGLRLCACTMCCKTALNLLLPDQ